jgi:hypothetical protein
MQLFERFFMSIFAKSVTPRLLARLTILLVGQFLMSTRDTSFVHWSFCSLEAPQPKILLASSMLIISRSREEACNFWNEYS